MSGAGALRARTDARRGGGGSGGFALPDFIVIGAMRAGTTTLYDRLSANPAIGMSREKETDFFIASKNWPRGLAWYASQFEGRRGVLGEASPNYTKAALFPGVPERVAATLPGCRLIFIARDPVARAASHYRHVFLSRGDAPGPDALVGSRFWANMVDASRYHRQISLYLEHFPRDRFLFLDFDELSASPAKVLSLIAAFLDVPDEWGAGEAGEARNTSEGIARIPRWVLRLREAPQAAGLRRRFPAPLRDFIRRAAELGPPRQAPRFDDRLKTLFAEEVREDAARLRDLTGMPFPGWSV